MLGGTLVTNGPLTLIEFPGVFVMLRQADAAAPPAGSVVDHFGLVYKDIAAARARWKAAGVKYDVGDTNPNQGYVYAPDSAIRVEVFGDPRCRDRWHGSRAHVSARSGYSGDPGVVRKSIRWLAGQAPARGQAGPHRVCLLPPVQSLLYSRHGEARCRPRAAPSITSASMCGTSRSSRRSWRRTASSSTRHRGRFPIRGRRSRFSPIRGEPISRSPRDWRRPRPRASSPRLEKARATPDSPSTTSGARRVHSPRC